MKTFGELFSLYTERAGISDTELARVMGVSRQTIFRWRQGTTSRPNKREDILAISKKLRLQPEEQDTLLLAAGFRPENIVQSVHDGSDISYTDLENEEENASESLLARVGKRKIYLSRRLLILIVAILVFIIIVVLLDWLQARTYNPFG